MATRRSNRGNSATPSWHDNETPSRRTPRMTQGSSEEAAASAVLPDVEIQRSFAYGAKKTPLLPRQLLLQNPKDTMEMAQILEADNAIADARIQDQRQAAGNISTFNANDRAARLARRNASREYSENGDSEPPHTRSASGVPGGKNKRPASNRGLDAVPEEITRHGSSSFVNDVSYDHERNVHDGFQIPGAFHEAPTPLFNRKVMRGVLRHRPDYLDNLPKDEVRALLEQLSLKDLHEAALQKPEWLRALPADHVQRVLGQFSTTEMGHLILAYPEFATTYAPLSSDQLRTIFHLPKPPSRVASIVKKVKEDRLWKIVFWLSLPFLILSTCFLFWNGTLGQAGHGLKEYYNVFHIGQHPLAFLPGWNREDFDLVHSWESRFKLVDSKISRIHGSIDAIRDGQNVKDANQKVDDMRRYLKQWQQDYGFEYSGPRYKDRLNDLEIKLNHVKYAMDHHVRLMLPHKDSGRILEAINYCAPGTGAVVDPTLTTPTKRKETSAVNNVWLWLTGWSKILSPPPMTALLGWNEIGDCWCSATKNKQTQLGVLFGHMIYPQNVVVEHMPRMATPGASATPKEMELWADISHYNASERSQLLQQALVWSTNDIFAPLDDIRQLASDPLLGPNFIRIGRWSYNIDEVDNIQQFDLWPPWKPGRRIINDEEGPYIEPVRTRRVVFRVKSNYGAPWTCLYRVRVHGEPVVPHAKVVYPHEDHDDLGEVDRGISSYHWLRPRVLNRYLSDLRAIVMPDHD